MRGTSEKSAPAQRLALSLFPSAAHRNSKIQHARLPRTHPIDMLANRAIAPAARWGLAAMRDSHSVDSGLTATTLDDITRSGRAKTSVKSRRSRGRRWKKCCALAWEEEVRTICPSGTSTVTSVTWVSDSESRRKWSRIRKKLKMNPKQNFAALTNYPPLRSSPSSPDFGVRLACCLYQPRASPTSEAVT